MNEKPLISVVTPVYLAEKIIPELVKRTSEELSKITPDFEIILVEDGSPDNSWGAIEEQCTKFNYVKGVKLSRNFGQHYAITAGVSVAKGKFSVIMDCDLQDNPSYIQQLYEKILLGYDTVFTIRINRKHGVIKTFSSFAFNFLFKILSNSDYNINYGSLVMFNHKVRREFLRLSERDRLYVQMLKWIGFKQTAIEVEHDERHSGKSSYTFFKLIKMAFQGWTAYSSRLLYFSIYVGVTFALCSFISLAGIFIYYWLYGFATGWASIMSTILFSTGLILTGIGIAGIYIGKTFEQGKNRQLFIIDEQLNSDES
ncbi:MAG: glycosyltransferase family 2 protein [Bacteroidia bacterium]